MKGKIKILHIQVTPVFSGAVKFSYDVLSNLDQAKYERFIIYSDFEPVREELKAEFVRKFEERGIKVIPATQLRRNIGFWDLRAITELRKLVMQVSPDIVNSISSKPWILGAVLAVLLPQVIFVHTIQGLSWHSGMSSLKRQFYYSCEWLAAFANKKLVFVNQQYMNFFSAHRSKSLYIPNCLTFNKDLIKNKNTEGDIRLLFVGRIDPQKDLLTLLRAFKVVVQSKSSRNIYLDIVGADTIGGGTEMRKCREFISENQEIAQYILFHGWQSDIRPFLERSDIFVSTSIYEGFGIVFLEAGNYYLPVVSTNVDGIPEVVANNHGGFLAEKGDYKTIAKHIEALCKDNSLRVQMGINHGEYVRRNFSQDIIVDKYDKFYQSLIHFN